MIPAPRTSRQLLNLFMLFKEERGANSIVGGIDFATAEARQIIFAAFGRLPEKREIVQNLNSPVRKIFNDVLHSAEFQRGIIQFILHALEEKTRLIFVHIPKCAGTDLIGHLASRFPSVNHSLTAPNWVSKQQLFAKLRDIAVYSHFHDDLFVNGHFNLQFFLQNELLRYSDRCFTVIRDPELIIISQVNYIMTRFIDDREQKFPDTREWLKMMDLERIPPDAGADYFRQLALKLLRNQSAIRKNYICTALGRETGKTALENIQTADIEITDTTRYNTWLKDEWGIAANTRRNELKKILTDKDIEPSERDYIDFITAEDRPLYAMIMNKLAESPRSFIKGSEL